MLKFRISRQSMTTDVKSLEIIKTEIREDFIHYEIRDGNVKSFDIIDDENIIEFTAKDIFNIQGDSILNGTNYVTLSNEDGSVTNQYTFNENLLVYSASKTDNTFSVRVKKRLMLNVVKFFIETRFNVIQFVDNQWVISKVSKEWITENNIPTENFIKTNEAACGIKDNLCGKPLGDDNKYYGECDVFYYENNAWNYVKLMKEDDMEGCLSGDSLDFTSFHEYDVDKDGNPNKRTMRKLDENEIYYTKENYISFECSPTHYFTSPLEVLELMDEDDENAKLMEKYTDYGKCVIKEKKYPYVYFFYNTNKNGIYLKEHIMLECHIDTDSLLSFNYDNLDKSLKKLMNKMLFSNVIKYDGDGDIPLQESDSGMFEVMRDNIMYNTDYTAFDISIDKSFNTIQIPISQKFETDLYHNDALNTHFTNDERINAINPIMDLEKDVYTPAICVKTNGEDGYMHVNGKYNDCNKITFNLHFREHRDDDGELWKCDNLAYWNGTKVIEKEFTDGDKKEIKKIVDLKGRVFQHENEDYKKNKEDYFSYFEVKPDDDSYDGDNDYDIDASDYKDKRDKRNTLKEYQSDTLAYLGFTNDDVKFQKSKLKKSFLRISFYDSDNVGNQNLLSTSTIFLDSGNLFAKYIKNIETDDLYEVREGNVTENGITYKKDNIIEGKVFRRLSLEDMKKCHIYGYPMAVTGNSKSTINPITDYNKNGVRVNREPMRKENLTLDEIYDNGELYEDLRLSAQITVTDKYNSKKSSEGFYFYTYKDNDNGVFPSDIYMRVEFNHAGYGRTLPFIMPYIRKSEEDEETGIDRYKGRTNKIKTFDDICYDWSEIDYDKGVAEENIKEDNLIGYGTVRYIKYAYIKWKYRYDKYTQKHIYYLDPDIYGDGALTEDGDNIILNLYEGKIR